MVLIKSKYYPAFFFVFYMVFFLLRGVFFTNYYMSNKSIFHFVLYIVMFLVGYVFYSLIFSQVFITKNTNQNFSFTKAIISVFFILIFIVFLGAKSGAFSYSFRDYYLIARGDSDALYSDVKEGFMGGSSVLNGLSTYLVYPLFVSVQAIACSVSLDSTRKIMFFVVMFLISLLYGYIYMSGYLVSSFFSFLILSIFFSPKTNKGKGLKVLFLLLLSLSVFFYLNVRTGGVNSYMNFRKYFLDYRTYGVGFYSKKLDDGDSVIWKPSYGASIAGGFVRLPYLIFKKLGFDGFEILSSSGENVNENDTAICIGSTKNGDLVSINAFSTPLFGMYRDFRIVGIVIYPFLIGFFLSFFYFKSCNSIKYRSLFFLLSLPLLSTYSMSPFDRQFFGFSFIYIIVVTSSSSFLGNFFRGCVFKKPLKKAGFV